MDVQGLRSFILNITKMLNRRLVRYISIYKSFLEAFFFKMLSCFLRLFLIAGCLYTPSNHDSLRQWLLDHNVKYIRTEKGSRGMIAVKPTTFGQWISVTL